MILEVILRLLAGIIRGMSRLKTAKIMECLCAHRFFAVAGKGGGAV